MGNNPCEETIANTGTSVMPIPKEGKREQNHQNEINWGKGDKIQKILDSKEKINFVMGTYACQDLFLIRH
jgi:hypothetical protein